MRLQLLLYLLLFATIVSSAAEEKEQRRTSSKPGWLGVGIQDVTPKFARDQNLKIKEGAYINEIVDDSPADSAGLKEGDIIVDFNGTPVETAEDLTDAVQGTAPGTKVTIKINRNGESKSLTATVRKNRMRTPFAIDAPHAPRVMVNMFAGDLQGMELMELNKQLGEYFEAPGGKGVLVQNVEKNSPAGKAGIKAGDVIIKFGDETVTDIGDIRETLSDSDEGTKLPVDVLRKGKKMTVTIEIAEDEDDDNGVFWRHRIPGNFNFHFEPEMNRLNDEIRMQMKELPKRHKELMRIDSKLRSKEV